MGHMVLFIMFVPRNDQNLREGLHGSGKIGAVVNHLGEARPTRVRVGVELAVNGNCQTGFLQGLPDQQLLQAEGEDRIAIYCGDNGDTLVDGGAGFNRITIDGPTDLSFSREDVARRLGFEAVAANSLDVSSDRDFVLEWAGLFGAADVQALERIRGRSLAWAGRASLRQPRYNGPGWSWPVSRTRPTLTE